MKPAIRVLVLVCIAAFAAAVAAPYWHAATMIVRAASIPGVVGHAARWDAIAVIDSLAEIPAAEGSIRARVFRPASHASTVVLLVSGVHPDGIEEPRLIDLARDLAATGVNVVTPEIADLKAYRLTANVTKAIETSGEWLSAQRDLTSTGRLGMIGVSFSGGLSIVAAGRPRLRDHVSYVLSFGGHGNLPRVLRYLSTGKPPIGAPGADRPPHDYAVAVLLHQAADLMVPPDQVVPLRRGIETFLRASALTRVDQQRAREVLQEGPSLQEQLPEPSATLLKLVFNRDVGALGLKVLPYLDRLGQDAALSPDQSPPPSAAVYLLHGSDDNVIPPEESELLAAHLRGKAHVRLLISPFLTHVDLAERPTVPDIWRMIAFWKNALAEH